VGDIAFTSDTLEHAALRFSALRSRAPAEYQATSNRRIHAQTAFGLRATLYCCATGFQFAL
jgi:hypothetical protein